MADLPANRSSPALRRRALGRIITRVGSAVLVVLLLLMILGGIGLVLSGLQGQQEALRLAVAPVCASGQVDGCRLHEQVIVVDLTTSYPPRQRAIQLVKVQRSSGEIQSVQDHEGDLFSQLYVTEPVNAELWKGNIIRLEDTAGHYLIADDSPVVTGAVQPYTGAFLIIVGGALLAVTIRGSLQQRRAGRK